MIAELVYIILGLAILWLALTIILDVREHVEQMRMLKKRRAWYEARTDKQEPSP